MAQQPIAEAAPWAVPGAECWVLHNYSRWDTKPIKAVIDRTTKTRVYAKDAQGRDHAFTADFLGKLTQYPRAGTWSPGNELVPKDDPGVPALLEKARRDRLVLAARNACSDFDRRHTLDTAQEALGSLTALLEAYPDGWDKP